MLHIIKSTDTKKETECGWCGKEIIPTSEKPKYFLSDAPVQGRVFFHAECAMEVIKKELKG